MKTSSKLVLSAVAIASAAFAQTSYADPGVAYNIGVMNEYRYRGLGQTRGKPALQGGLDFDAGNGFYLGAWGSNIKWIKDQSTDTQDVKGSVELDLYGGYKFEAGGLGYDVGFLRYQYVSNKLQDAAGSGAGVTYKNANTNEIYGAVTAGAFMAKYSYAMSNLFGNYNFDKSQSTRGSYYLDLSYTVDIGNGMTLVPHVGRQKLKHLDGASNVSGNPSYTDFALTLNKDLGAGLSASVAAIGTNADKNVYTIAPSGSSVNYYQGKSQLVAGLKYTF